MDAGVLFTAQAGLGPGLPSSAQGADALARPRGRRWTGRLFRGLVNLLMCGLVALFTVVALLPATGARAMIVLSGSMEPLLAAGDAAIIRDVPVDDLRVGDVITFHPIGTDKRLTTHRIVGRVELPSGLHFRTQGDANAVPDVDLAPARNVVGRYDGMIPQAGRALLLLSSRQAKLVLITLPAVCVLAGELSALARTLRRRGDAIGWGIPRPAVALTALALAAAVGVTATRATMAVFTDVATIADNRLATTDTF